MIRDKYKLVLCEGPIDALLIKKYLVDIKKYSVISNELTYNYKNVLVQYKNTIFTDTDGNILFVYEAGGKNNFNEFLKSVKYLNSSEVVFSNILIIADHDDETSERFVQQLDYIFMNNKKGVPRFKINEKYFINYIDGFGSNVSYTVRYALIPTHEMGAIEDFLLDVLSEKNNDIIDISKDVDDLISIIGKKGKYLTKRRLKVKARFAITNDVIDPERNYGGLKKIEKIDWKTYEKFKTYFSILNDV